MNLTSAIHKVRKLFSIAATINELKEAIRDLPTTNWLTFTGTLMGITTGIFFLIIWIVKIILALKYGGVVGWEMPKIIHLDIFVAWLGFLATWMGFSVRQFKHKRETYINGEGKSIRHIQMNSKAEK